MEMKIHIDPHHYRNIKNAIGKNFQLSYNKDIFLLTDKPCKEKFTQVLLILFHVFIFILNRQNHIKWVQIQYFFRMKDNVIAFSPKMALLPRMEKYMIEKHKENLIRIPKMYRWTQVVDFLDIEIHILNINLTDQPKASKSLILKQVELPIPTSDNKWFHKEQIKYPKNDQKYIDDHYLTRSYFHNIEKKKWNHISYFNNIKSKTRKRKRILLPKTLYCITKALETYLRKEKNRMNGLIQCTFQAKEVDGNWINISHNFYLYKHDPELLETTKFKIFTFEELIDLIPKFHLKENKLYNDDFLYTVIKRELLDIRISIKLPRFFYKRVPLHFPINK